MLLYRKTIERFKYKKWLSYGSQKKVIILCDYCGKTSLRKYQIYFKAKRENLCKKTCCQKCTARKGADSFELKHGVRNFWGAPEKRENCKKVHPKWWTKEEDQILTENYLKFQVKEFKHLLPSRTEICIRYRIDFLKLQKFTPFTYDKTFFKEPNLINCLLAGELATDGCIKIDKWGGYHIDFNKCIEDIVYLEKIKNIIKFNGNIHYYTKPKNYKIRGRIIRKVCTMGRITLNNSAEMAIDLKNNWGIVPRKTFLMEAPNITDLKLILAYYLGSIFGDGNIDFKKYKTRNLNMSVGLLGTKNFLYFFKNILDRITPYHNQSSIRIAKKEEKIYIYKIVGAKAYIVLKMITCLGLKQYSLDRKYNKIEQFVDYIENTKLHWKFLDGIKKNITKEVIDFLNKYNVKFPDRFLQ